MRGWGRLGRGRELGSESVSPGKLAPTALLAFAMVCLAGVPALVEAVAQRPAVHRLAEGETLRVPASRDAVRIPLSLAGGADAGGQLWVQRVAVDEIWVERGRWRSESQSFFQPHPDGSAFPTGFVFPLPEGGLAD